MSTPVQSRVGPVSGAPAASATSSRLMSVDALRGFDMFWIIGADALVYALNRMSHTRASGFLATQLEHADWEGFHFYDLIFPLFIFIVGVSLVFSLSKTIEAAGLGAALARVLRRGALLFLIGIFYSGGLTNPWPDVRLMGVLNRIALTYTLAALLFCFFRPRTLAGIAVALLAGYWAIMTFVPVRDVQLTKPNLAQLAEEAGDIEAAALLRTPANPSAVKDSPAWAAAERIFYGTTNYVTHSFGKGHNLSDHLDFQYLPGRKYDTFFDPEGYLSTIPAVVTCLLGVFAGLLLRNQSIADARKALLLIGCGIVAAAMGWLWNFQFPVIKKIWTSSYVLVAGGYSAILLGIFYTVVDIWKSRAWCQPLVWMGMNSITIYVANNIVGGFRRIAARIAGGDVSLWFDERLAQGAGGMVISILGLGLAFWLVRFLYKRKIFLRL